MIYILEDDASIRNFVEYALNNSALPSKGFERPSQLWRALEEDIPSLILLDIMLRGFEKATGWSRYKKHTRNNAYSKVDGIR